MNPALPDATYQPAPLWRRFLAMVYDLLPLIALWMVGTALWLWLGSWLFPSQKAQMASFGRWSVANWGFRVYLLAIAFSYYGPSWRYGGQTLGMRAWRIRVLDGGRTDPISWAQAFIRFATALLGTMLAGLGFFWALFDRQKRTWHDLTSRSLTVRCAPKVQAQEAKK